MVLNCKSFKIYLLALLTLIGLSACGGGSAGTGTGDSSFRVQGIVQNSDGQPVEAALVTIVESGDSDITNKQGEFLITSDSSDSQLTLEIEKGGSSATTKITAPGEHGTISINIKFDDVREVVATNELSVQSKIVGACDVYFENFRTIRQANKVPENISCVLKVSVSAAGKPVPHVPIAVQFSGCSGQTAWLTAALGATLSGSNIGVAQIEFPFFDDSKHCLYRIVTPFGEKTLIPAVTEIQTLTFQSKSSNQR
jgi:hypothetical protein